MANETRDTKAAGGVGNLAFYRMCAEFGSHDNVSDVKSKMMFIARVYSVSRGLGGQWEQLAEEIVSKHSDLDRRIAAARREPFLDIKYHVLETHKFLDDLVCKTLRKREKTVDGRASFSSKYLHFHAPDAFPIFDSFARSGLKAFTPDFRTALKNPLPYERFCERFEYYIISCRQKGKSLRKIDTKLFKKGKDK